MNKKLIFLLLVFLVPSLVNAQTSYQIGDEIKAHVEMIVTGEVRTVGFDMLYDTTKLAYNGNELYDIFDHEIYNNFDGRGAAGFNMISNDKPSVTDTTVTLLTVSFLAKEEGTTEITFNNGFAGIGESPADETDWENGNLDIIEISINRVAFKIIIE